MTGRLIHFVLERFQRVSEEVLGVLGRQLDLKNFKNEIILSKAKVIYHIAGISILEYTNPKLIYKTEQSTLSTRVNIL